MWNSNVNQLAYGKFQILKKVLFMQGMLKNGSTLIYTVKAFLCTQNGKWNNRYNKSCTIKETLVNCTKIMNCDVKYQAMTT